MSSVLENQFKFWREIAKEPIGWAAFGLLVIMILTQYLFWPLLTQRQLDYEQLTRITESQAEIARSMESTAESMSATAHSLTVTATIMDKTVDRLEKIEDRN